MKGIYAQIRMKFRSWFPHPSEKSSDTAYQARWVLTAFLVTFALSRIVVFLIMSRTIPDLYMHLGGTHIHHLNYGIFLLSGVGAYFVFARPSERARRIVSLVYAVGLALTFDEFGMWVHLGGGYWQRASFDAVFVITALLTLLVLAPSLKQWKVRQVLSAGIIFFVVSLFFVMLMDSFNHIEKKWELRFDHLEQYGPR